MNVTKEDIIDFFPIREPYKFIDRILEVDEKQIRATYQFKEEEFFFAGHFPTYPVVPGAILQEAAAQTGLLAFGMFLLGNGHVTLSEIPQGVLEEITGGSRLTAGDHNDFDAAGVSDLPEGFLSNTFYLTSVEMAYKKVVRPLETIIISAEKIFFRFNKFKTKVLIESSENEVIGKGIMSGIVVSGNLWKTGL